jgi:dTDP-4-dehydrorhamnose reductase
VRTAAFFSPFDSHNFAAALLDLLRRGADFWCADDLTVSPTYVPDLVDAALDLLIDGEVGLWHLANRGETTWAAFAADLARACGLDIGRVKGAPWRTLGYRAQRPPHVPLASERGVLMPTLAEAIVRFARSASEEAHSRSDSREPRRRRADGDSPLSSAMELSGRREMGLIAE